MCRGKLHNGLLAREVSWKRQKPLKMEENHRQNGQNVPKFRVSSEFSGLPLNSPEIEVEKRLLRNLAMCRGTLSLSQKFSLMCLCGSLSSDYDAPPSLFQGTSASEKGVFWKRGTKVCLSRDSRFPLACGQTWRIFRRGCSQSELQVKITFVAVKNVVKFSVTNFKPIFPAESWQNICHQKSTTVSTPKFSKFHHLALLRPLSCEESGHVLEILHWKGPFVATPFPCSGM